MSPTTTRRRRQQQQQRPQCLSVAAPLLLFWMAPSFHRHQHLFAHAFGTNSVVRTTRPTASRPLVSQTLLRLHSSVVSGDTSNKSSSSLSPSSSSSDLLANLASRAAAVKVPSIGPVLSAALLITGNTVGAGALILPDLAQGPGLLCSSGIFVFCYLINLVSGLVIAQVAIQQQQQGQEVPSSFMEFAESSLQSPWAATVIAALSLFVNGCVMSFDLSRVGDLAASMAGPIGGLDPTLATLGWTAGAVALLSSLSSAKLSNLASVSVAVLLGSLGGLLIPGVAAVHDPVATWLAPGTSDSVLSGVATALPVILMSMVYQNIVPSIAKILNYDRCQTVAAVAMGSGVPLVLYLAWTYACLGGGIHHHGAGGEGPLMTIFTLATLVGSTIGSGMSLSEELQQLVGSRFKDEGSSSQENTAAAADADASAQGFSLPATLAAVSAPLSVALWFAHNHHDLSGALKIAGSIGAPLLYGVIPALMAWQQAQKADTRRSSMLVPQAGLGMLGVAATGFVGQEFFHSITQVLNAVSV